MLRALLRTIVSFAWLWFGGCYWQATLAADDQAEASASFDFDRDIRPLLSDRCFTCHGPDSNRRVTDLRLDQRESALQFAVSLEHPSESELIKRIDSQDADLVMPPPESKLTLSEEERRLLKAWVNAGAVYEDHWAFRSVSRPPVPELVQSGWATNPIDHFIVNQLQLSNVGPASQAAPATLLRRLALDLTGLPPSLEEQRKFAAEWASVSPPANGESLSTAQLAVYEDWVDHYLASPRYGERMAVDWLDVARYADTYGYQADRYRPMWPWRDWVVKAFNDNLPYHEFVRWQLAGDLLPNPTREQLLATAFNRHHRQTNEGGSVEEEFRSEYVADRVNTFGAAFLGLTLECCRCHDHKYDPLTQREYYSLSSFFNNLDESGLYSHFTDATPTPALPLSNDDQDARLAAVEEQIVALEKQLQELQISDEQFTQWRESLAESQELATSAEGRLSLQELLQTSLQKGLVGEFGFENLEGGKLANGAQGRPAGSTSEGPQLVSGPVGNALQFSGENNATFTAGGDFTRDQPFSFALWINPPERFQRAVIFHRSRAWTDSGSHGYELLIEDGKLSFGLIHFWPGNAIRIATKEELPTNAWRHVSITYDGSSRATGLRMYIDGELSPVDIVRDHLTREIHSGEPNELTLAQRFRDVGFKLGSIDELKIYDRELTALEVAAIHSNVVELRTAAGLEVGHEAALLEFATTQLEPLATQRAELIKALAELRKQRHDLVESIPQIMVMSEMSGRRPTFVLQRGAYDAPGAEVTRGVFAKLSPELPNADAPSRLDLANWLTDPQHPLTSRVFVNRLWQAFYGNGIVSTTEDFGLQGAAPSHPELLDWLAAEFMESGWNVKHLVKLIVMSSTYRQSSDVRPELLERDPENQLYARGPVFRLSAEMLRDSALFASGLLIDKSGGAPVKPFQPEGLWEEKSGEAYHRDVGEGSHRRSLYTFWKRTSPPPAMMTFDASNREVCVVRRQSTSTPLQVLVMLNDPQMVEAAAALAGRSLEGREAPAAVAEVFRLLCSREPSERELQVLNRLHAEQLEFFQNRVEDARQYLTVGDYRPPDALDPIQVAAVATVAQALMSFDEFMMKR